MPKVVLAGSGGLPYPALKAIIKSKADIVLFGDSVMERVSRHDEDRRTLGEMISQQLAPQSVLTLSRSAHNPDIYLPLLRAMKKVRHRPKTIIIPINLRSFSPQWERSPDWSFEQEKAIIARYLRWRWSKIPAVSDVYLDASRHADFDEQEVDFELSPFKTIGEFRRLIRSEPSPERSASIFIFHYTHRLSRSNPRLQSLKECVAIAQAIARQVLLYVTPINSKALERFVGEQATAIVQDNVATIREVLDNQTVLDWSCAAAENHFFSEDLATEHLNEAGRKSLADLVVSKL